MTPGELLAWVGAIALAVVIVLCAIAIAINLIRGMRPDKSKTKNYPIITKEHR